MSVNGRQRDTERLLDDTDVDPFTYRPQFSKWDWIKVVFNTIWLVPLRLFCIVLPCVLAGTIVCSIGTACEHFDEANQQPLRGWRKFIVHKVGPKISRLFLFGFGFHWIQIQGKQADTVEAPIMVVAPHSSVFDIFIVGTYHVPSFVSRNEIRGIPLFGTLILRALRTIFVDREGDTSRTNTAEEINRRASSGGNWPKVMIFPEGTTTNRRVLLKFKLGAFSPKLPIQPLLIKYKNRVNTMLWGDNGMGLIAGLFYTLCQFHNKLELEWLPVYNPSEEEMDDAKLYAENVRQVMSHALNIRTSEHTFEDMILMRYARQLSMPITSGMLVYSEIRTQLGMKVDEIKAFMKRFCSMDRDMDGFISADDMSQYLGVPKDVCLQAVFDAFELTDHGLLFQDYLYGIIRLSAPLLANEVLIQSMFQFFDGDQDGIVNAKDFAKLPIQHIMTEEHDDYDSTMHMDFDEFKQVLKVNREYLVLFHECQNAGISSPSWV